MPLIKWNSLETEEPYPGIRRARVDGERLTAVYYAFAPGASFPVHAHAEEQLIYLIEGSVRMVNGEETLLVRAGESVWTPSDVPHSITAEGEAVFLNLIVPRRSDPISMPPP